MSELSPQIGLLWERRARSLTQLLIFSGALNLGLLTTVLYNLWNGEKILPPQEARLELAAESSYAAALLELSRSPLSELIDLLKDTTPIEQGLLRRDLALSVLYSVQKLDLERALGSLPQQTRLLQLQVPDQSAPLELRLFLGLSNEQFAAISQFVRQERWPFTPSGLFAELARQGAHADPSLIDAFSTTSHFYAVSALFSRTGLNIDKKVLISMLLEGGWDLLSQFVAAPPVPPEQLWQRRREFLLAHLGQGSRIAARILVETDTEALLRRLTDEQATQILNLLSTHTPSFERFVRGLLASPRSDLVWQAAESRLHSFTGELRPPPPPLPHPPPPGEVEPPLRRMHLVQEGDSLWKIARRYSVTIDALMEENNLDNERLRPGAQLLIPGP